MEQAHTRRGEQEVKNKLERQMYMLGVFHFTSCNVIECVVEFMIDSRTILRWGTLTLNSYLSVTRCELTVHMHWTQ